MLGVLGVAAIAFAVVVMAVARRGVVLVGPVGTLLWQQRQPRELRLVAVVPVGERAFCWWVGTRAKAAKQWEWKMLKAAGRTEERGKNGRTRRSSSPACNCEPIVDSWIDFQQYKSFRPELLSSA
ncbi:hypothetical protein BDZ88DRAFT_486913 [Geranomyces variabilis]|nr:hypothetical protein BDZ88DRAFT_486913 [Geranomyces variabilis]